MERIGISFRSTLSPDEIRRQYVRPLRAAIESASAGIFSNYLRQDDQDESLATEHLLVFQVRDFKEGLRLLRLELDRGDRPDDVHFHNLNPSDPLY